MRYALLARCDENALVTPDEQAAREKVFASFAEERRARGVLLPGHRQLPTTAARTVPVWCGDVVTADGGPRLRSGRTSLSSRAVAVIAPCRG